MHKLDECKQNKNWLLSATAPDFYTMQEASAASRLPYRGYLSSWCNTGKSLKTTPGMKGKDDRLLSFGIQSH